MTEKDSAGSNISILEIDDKGRLTLPKKIWESLNVRKKVLLINAGDHLKIIPLPSGPFQTLYGAFSVKKPFEAMRREAERVAENEAKKGRG